MICFKKKNHHGWKDSRENGKVEKASATACKELTLAQRSRGAPGGSNPVMLLGGKSSVDGLDGRADLAQSLSVIQFRGVSGLLRK